MFCATKNEPMNWVSFISHKKIRGRPCLDQSIGNPYSTWSTVGQKGVHSLASFNWFVSIFGWITRKIKHNLSNRRSLADWCSTDPSFSNINLANIGHPTMLLVLFWWSLRMKSSPIPVYEQHAMRGRSVNSTPDCSMSGVIEIKSDPRMSTTALFLEKPV